jgi:hypothetical protein
MLPLLLLLALAAPPPRAPAPARPLPVIAALTVKTTQGEARASAAPGEAPAPRREVVVMKAGEKPQIRWSVRNPDARKAAGELVVHFLVTREGAPGEEIARGVRKGSLIDQVLGTNLAPRESVSGSFNTAVYEPGAYLVELELLDPRGVRLRYCAVDLTVE